MSISFAFCTPERKMGYLEDWQLRAACFRLYAAVSI
jgi:hypothetical protein